MDPFLSLALLAIAAGAASPAGGMLALLIRPSSLLLSLSVGYAGGVLLVWAFDLYIARGMTAGERAEQRSEVRQHHRRHRPRGRKVDVIAGATAGEEIVEGLVIGVSAAIGGGTAIVVAAAIAVDNLAEALSIAELAQADDGIKH